MTQARLDVQKNGKPMDILHPKRVVVDNFESLPTSQVAIRSTPKEDLYVLLAAWDDQVATFLIFVNPLVIWLWIGGIVFLMGTMIAVWPEGQPVRVTASQRVPGAAPSEA